MSVWCLWVDSMFVVFEQETAYDMRISDCSSDVCSSDLVINDPLFESSQRIHAKLTERVRHTLLGGSKDSMSLLIICLVDAGVTSQCAKNHSEFYQMRSQERRVGNECVSTGRSRGSPNHYKKHNKQTC